MATITDQVKAVNRGSGLSHIGPAVYKIENTIDLSAVTGSTDVITVFTATSHNLFVHSVVVEVETATTNATQISLGDGGDVDALLVATVANATGFISGSTLGNHVIASGDTLDMVLSVAAPGGTGSIRVVAFVSDADNADGS